MKFQYFSNKIQGSAPLGFIGLDRFINATRTPKNKEVFEAIGKASAEGNLELKAELKQNNLYYFTPCVVVNERRKYSHIIKWTGLLVLDFDKIDNALELKQHLFESFDFVIASWISPSKRGVKAFVKIPVVTSTDDFKRHFKAIEQVFEAYDGFDTTAKNCVLPLFQSYDADILYRTDATTFTEQCEIEEYNPEPVKVIQFESTAFDSLRAVAMIKSSINKITSEGHPQIRGASIFAGGLVASGYLQQYECEQLVESLIRSNEYLSKGISGYVSTSRWGIKQGLNKQIILENNVR